MRAHHSSVNPYTCPHVPRSPIAALRLHRTHARCAPVPAGQPPPHNCRETIGLAMRDASPHTVYLYSATLRCVRMPDMSLLTGEGISLMSTALPLPLVHPALWKARCRSRIWSTHVVQRTAPSGILDLGIAI